jgi:hypothetical protein
MSPLAGPIGYYTKVVKFNLRIPTKLVWHFSKFSTIFYKFLKFIAHMPLARWGRKTGRSPAKFRRGDGEGLEEEWSASTSRSRRTCWGSWEGEGMTGGGVPTAAEAAAEGCSLARGFPARRRAKLGLDNCRRMRGSYGSSRIGWRRGKGSSSTVTGAYRRRGERRRGSSSGGPATGSGW